MLPLLKYRFIVLKQNTLMDSSYTPSESFTNDIRPPPFAPTTTHRNTGCEECQRRQAKLSDQLKGVTIMNDKWQKYNKDREHYVEDLLRDIKRLTQKLEGTEKKLKDTKGELSQTRASETHSKQMLKDQQTTIGNFSKLMDDLEHKTRKEQIQSTRIDELEKELQSVMKVDRSSRVDVSERVELLQQQLEVCIDDFKTEKREKERYKDETTTLRVKSEETENLLRDYQAKVALIQSLQFPSVPSFVSASNRNSSGKRSSAEPTRKNNQTSPRLPKPSSWSYPLDFPTFPNSIEADCIEERGSQSDSALYDVNIVEGILAKPLNQLHKGSQEVEEAKQNDLGRLGSDFLHEQLELVRH